MTKEITPQELREAIATGFTFEAIPGEKETYLTAFDAMAEKASLYEKLERLWIEKSEPECLWNPGTSEYYIQLNDYPYRYFGKTPAEVLKAVPE